MRPPDGHHSYTSPSGIRTKWPSGLRTPLYSNLHLHRWRQAIELTEKPDYHCNRENWNSHKFSITYAALDNLRFSPMFELKSQLQNLRWKPRTVLRPNIYCDMIKRISSNSQWRSFFMQSRRKKKQWYKDTNLKIKGTVWSFSDATYFDSLSVEFFCLTELENQDKSHVAWIRLYRVGIYRGKSAFDSNFLTFVEGNRVGS